MNKKEYIKPKSKHILVACSSLLADSIPGPETFPDPTPDPNPNPEVDSKFSLWEDED